MVFAVIDDLPVEERLRRADRLFNLSLASAQGTLRRLATQHLNGDVDAVWLIAASLHYIVDRRIEGLYPLVRQAAARETPELLEETTALLFRRMDDGGRSGRAVLRPIASLDRRQVFLGWFGIFSESPIL